MQIRLAITAAALACLLLPAAARADTAHPTGRLLAVLDKAPLEIAPVSPAPGQSLADLRAELHADPAVKRVDTEYFRELRGYVPNDPAYSAFDSFNAPFPPNGDRYQWNLRKANFETAWALSHGAGAKVAIVDTGVSASSPDLTQVFAYHDTYPLDLAGQATDQNGHGTHVAGLACGDTDNGYGIASAGFDCPLIVEKLQVSGNMLTDASVIEGITDATARGAAVINLSLGGCGPSTGLRNAIDQAWAAGAVLVAAASNPGDQCGGAQPQGYPAAYVQPAGTSPDPYSGKGLVVTMAQYDGANAGAGHGTGVSVAAYGDSSALAAPGHPNGLPGIFSTWPQNTTTREGSCSTPPCAPRTSFNGDNRFGYLFGTSMATPQVSGLVALVRSANPGMSPSQVIQAIKRTAGYGGVWHDSLGWGIVDAGRAVALAAGRDLVGPVSKVASKKRTRKRGFKLRISSSDADPLGGSVSGVDSVSVFVAKGRGAFKLLSKTKRSKISFRGRPGVKYKFYSRAVDKAGNHEADRAVADTATWVRRRPRR